MRFMFEAYAVSIHNLQMSLLQRRIRTYDIYFSIAPPVHAGRYRQLEPTRVHFGVGELPEVRIVMSASQVDLPVTTAYPELVVESETRCKTLLDNTRHALPWSEWVRLILHEAEHCQPTIEQLAQLLNMGPRTLSRHLQRERRNFRTLSEAGCATNVPAACCARAARRLRKSPTTSATRAWPRSARRFAAWPGRVRAHGAMCIWAAIERVWMHAGVCRLSLRWFGTLICQYLMLFTLLAIIFRGSSYRSITRFHARPASMV